jgi:hypothetical protein
MRNRLIILFFIVAGGLAISTVTVAQRGAAPETAQRGAAPRGGGQRQTLNPIFEQATNKPFKPHDFAGIWSRNSEGFGGGGTCFDCGDRGFSNDWPSFTPEGQKRFDANKPSYGRALGSADANAHPEEHIGRRRAVPPANDTDPASHCNPEGLTRALIYPDPIEFIELPDRILQHFQWRYYIRTIWLDGRPPLKDPDQLRWWGYSTGHWEGDTLVVETDGVDPRTWVDHFGNPHSDEMHVQERYKRVNYNTIELSMTLTDPKTYTKPWVSQTKRFHLIPKENVKTVDGWKGLIEDFCAPADEVDQFNQRVRDPAGGVIHK